MKTKDNYKISNKIIVVAGVSSGSGKTSLAEAVIGYLSRKKSVTACKITVIHSDRGCPHGSSSCNTCTSFIGDYQIISKQSIINQKGTDTNRFVEAGGNTVLWTITRDRVFEESWNLMKKSFKENSVVVIESNTLALALIKKPAVTLMVVDPTVSRKIWKNSAEMLIKEADIVIFNRRGRAEQIAKTNCEVLRIRGRLDDVIYLTHPHRIVFDNVFMERLNRLLT